MKPLLAWCNMWASWFMRVLTGNKKNNILWPWLTRKKEMEIFIFLAERENVVA